MTDISDLLPVSGLPGRVVDLCRRRPADDSRLQPLVAYWAGLCRDGGVPRRMDVDPRRIGPLLPGTFILEKIAPGLARFRVAGAQLAGLMGMDVRGMPVSAFIRPEARDGFAGALARLFEEPAVLRLSLRAKAGVGRPALAGRMVLLPLRSDLGDVSRAIGCVVTEGAPGRAPRRFDINGLTVEPVPGARPGPAAALPLPRPMRPGERPYLRLVVTD